MGAFFALLLGVEVGKGQSAWPLPEKLQSAKANYEAAVARATAPLTKSYAQEIERLKLEYTRAGNLQAALAAEALLKGLAAPGGATAKSGEAAGTLGAMGVDQFKAWLASVAIRELSGFRNRFTYDGKVLTSAKDGAAPRVHENVTITVGRIFVPFTSTNATIVVDPSRTKAEVTYSTGQKFDAKIEPKNKD